VRLDAQQVPGEDAMTLRLRCTRCGELDEMDPADVYTWGLCFGSHRKALATIGGASARELDAFNRFHARYQKNATNHPTFKALTAALDALETTPHGALREDIHG
jgi:hypothetical protein